MNAIAQLPDVPARILLVDDEGYNLKLLEIMLGPEGYDLQSASSGQQALDVVARDQPDLILLDVMMPGLDGYVVAQRLKGGLETCKIPIIMVTALDSRAARIRGLEAGAEDFLHRHQHVRDGWPCPCPPRPLPPTLRETSLYVWPRGRFPPTTQWRHRSHSPGAKAL